MKLEDQVCSLDLANRLKELGVKQESLFGWYKVWRGASDSSTGRNIYEWQLMPYEEGDKVNEFAAAFTVAELGMMLPQTISDDEDGSVFQLYVIKKDDGWYVSYRYEYPKHDYASIYVEEAPTEADARAKMLIYLIENKLITV